MTLRCAAPNEEAIRTTVLSHPALEDCARDCLAATGSHCLPVSRPDPWRFPDAAGVERCRLQQSTFLGCSRSFLRPRLLLAQLRPALSSAVSFVRTTEPGLLAEYAVGGLALYYLVSPVYFQNDYMVQGSECMG